MQKLDFKKQFTQIQEFQTNFDFPVFPFNHQKARKLRFELIVEEWRETLDGIKAYSENKTAINLKEIADGLADLAYVTLGAIHTFNFELNLMKGHLAMQQSSDEMTIDYVIQNLLEENEYVYEAGLQIILINIERLWNQYLIDVPFEEVYDEVHSSNMSKACETLEVAYLTINKYNKEKDENDFRCKFGSDGKVYIHKYSNNKVLKSINYKEADILSIVKKYISFN